MENTEKSAEIRKVFRLSIVSAILVAAGIITSVLTLEKGSTAKMVVMLSLVIYSFVSSYLFKKRIAQINKKYESGNA